MSRSLKTNINSGLVGSFSKGCGINAMDKVFATTSTSEITYCIIQEQWLTLIDIFEKCM
jgi:uncharacterized membrane protein YuzA (DUF378 family)